MKKLISRRNFLKAAALAGSAVTLTACGGSKADTPVANEQGVVESTEQTAFTIIGGQGALSPGYADNQVLNEMQEAAGISIEWNTMSDSLAEQVNIRIAGGDWPDAFMGVGFSNYDLTNYGADGIFINLEPYITPDIMPNLSAILEAHPNIKSGPPQHQVGHHHERRLHLRPARRRADGHRRHRQGGGLLHLHHPPVLDDQQGVAGRPRPRSAHHPRRAARRAEGVQGQRHEPQVLRQRRRHHPAHVHDQWCWGQNIFYAGFGFTNWPNDVCNDLVLQGDGTIKFMCVDDKYREAVTYFHDWYAEGLMDIEMFSQSDTQLMSKCQQGWVGVSTWWYIDELMGDYAKDYVFLPILSGPDGTKNVTVRTGGGTNSGQLSITSICQSPINLLKFFDQWYTGENVMQLQYGPIGVYFTEQDENGVWLSITDEEAQAQFGKSAGELKGEYEVAGPKLILSEYYEDTFKMEDRAIERLTDLYDYWMPQVTDTSVYPVDCVFTTDELDTIDRYKPDFESMVSEQEGLWIRDGGPTDEEWEDYKQMLADTCGMNDLLKVYQDAYARYTTA